jgi:O-antigen/teichoic acid export membrane protein
MREQGTFYYIKILFKGSFSLGLSEGISKIIGLILLPIFTFYLSPEDFGVISLVMIISNFLNLIYNPGILSATTRLFYLTENESDKQNLIGSAAVFFLVVPTLVTTLFLFLGQFVFSKVFENFAFFPYGVLGLLLGFFTQIKRLWLTLCSLLFELHRITNVLLIAILLGTCISILFVIVFQLGAIGRIAAMLLPAGYLFVISLNSLVNYTKLNWSIIKLKEIFLLGYPLTIAIWSYEVLHLMDRLILERMLDVKSVGLYSFGYQIAELPLIFIVGFRQLWSPIFYKNMNEKNYDNISNLLNVYIFIISFIISIVILFNNEFLLILVDNVYFKSSEVISLVAVGIYFSALLILSNTILGYEQRFGVTSFMAMCAAIINVILNIYLIPTMGIVGSALATSIAYFVYFIWGLFITRNISKRFNFILKLILPTIFVIFSYFISRVYGGANLLFSVFFTKIFVIVCFVLLFFRYQSPGLFSIFLSLLKKNNPSD